MEMILILLLISCWESRGKNNKEECDENSFKQFPVLQKKY